MTKGYGCAGLTRLQRSVLPAVVLLVLALLLSPFRHDTVATQPTAPAGGCLVASEPNDQPVDAMALPAGASCVTASSAGPAQDLYRWTVSRAEAATRWTLAVSPIPAQVTRLEVYTVELDDAGAVTAATMLVSALGQASEPVSHNDLLWAPGDYYIAVATSGPGDYTFTIEEGVPVSGTGDPDGEASGAFERSATADGAVTWTLDETGSGSRWILQLQGGVGQALTLAMTDEMGTTLLTAQVGSDGVASVPDVGLAPGTYTLSVTGAADDGTPWILSATEAGARAAGEEDEPNDTAATSWPLALADDAAVASGRLAKRGPANQADRDVYRLAIDGEHAGRFTDLRLLWQGEVERELCLLDAVETELACTTGSGGVALHDLVLPTGDYLVEVSGVAVPDVPYLLRVEVTGEAVTGFEAEPNERPEQASPLAPDGEGFAGGGRLSALDVDHFRVTVSGEPQLWLIAIEGTGLAEAHLLDGAGTSTMPAAAVEGGLAIVDAYLVPGDHVVRVRGSDGDYQVTLTPLGPPDPQHEREPNDTPDRSQPLRLTEERTGRLPTMQDRDIYRFSLQGPSYLRVDLAVPGDGAFTMAIAWQEIEVTRLSSVEPGAALTYAGLLEPGDYTIALTAGTPSEEPYAMTLTPLDPFDLPDDLEPNGDPWLARPMPESLRVAGIADPADGRGGDVDWYVLPQRDAPADYTLSHTPDARVEVLASDGFGLPPVPVPLLPAVDAGEWTVSLPADTEVFLKVSGAGPYEVALWPSGQQPPAAMPAPTAPEISLALELDDDPVAAYWAQGQRVDGTLTIENPDDALQEVVLDALTGNALWGVELDQTTVPIAAGESATVPVTIHIAPDARAAEPVFVAVRATGEVEAASAMALITPDRATVPTLVAPWWPLPDGVLGGINVAWSGLGAMPVALDEATATAESPLYDDMTTVGNGWSTGTTSLPVDLTVDLAGDEPVPVSGFVIFPAGSELGVGARIRDYELELSMDGQVFAPVAAGTLSPMAMDQVIALDDPVEARFARLRVLSAVNPTVSAVTLGEWKVIAAPGWVLDSDAGLDLADPALGGHIVDVQPPLSNPRDSDFLLVPGETPQVIGGEPGSPVSWIVGFQHDRAGQVTGFAWVDPPGSDPARQMDLVLIEVSTGSPVGPWEPLGDWNLERDATGTATLTLDEPAWARFVRFTGTVPEGEGDTVEVELPDVIRVVEREADGEYRSILGEWGGSSRGATYEYLEPVEGPELDEDAGNDAAAATVLPPGESRTDVVAIGVDEDWYRIEMPAGTSELEVTIGGFPAVGVTAELFDESGDPVEVKTSQAAVDAVLVSASVDPGGTYLLRVTQPPTSVVIAFDTSFSIGTLEPAVYQGLNRFASDIEPGREFVNVLPFGEQLLLSEWSDDPYVIQETIAAYPRTAVSSDAEGAILASTEALEERAGTRAIFLISDGETVMTYDQAVKLWPGLGATVPRIFSVGIAGSMDAARGQDLMQDWATVGDGHYVYARDQGAMDVAFDRAATELRRPTAYSITAAASAPPATPAPAPTPTPEPPLLPATPPPDGTLLVTAPEVIPGQPVASAEGQVAIILDTSGSMLQPLEGSTRADIAKTALVDLVTTTIPPGTTVSLRTFGDTPDSCETLLVVPPGPLDPALVAETITSLPVVNLVRTPIGAALEATLGDVTAGEGPRIVVLVTDGEETCDGDPGAAIQALADSGVDVRVNIVGFAIDDPALAETFQDWARMGNGRYIDAGDAGELNRAVAEAVLPTYDVIDGSAAVVASGQAGGEPVSLPPGTYQVVVHTAPEQVIDVVIEPGEETTVPL